MEKPFVGGDNPPECVAMEQTNGDRTVPDPANQSNLDHNASEICKLIKTKQWLENQVIDLKKQLKVNELSQNTSVPSEPEKVEESIAKLQKTLQETCINSVMKSLMLSRAQQGDTLLKYLFVDVGAGDSTETSSEHQAKHKFITDIVAKQTKLTSLISQINGENEKKLQSLNDLKRQNLDLKQKVRELMHHLVKAKESQTDNQTEEQGEKITRAREKLQHIEQKTELMQHLFQSLILGSGINWAEDEELTKLLIELGQPIEDHL